MDASGGLDPLIHELREMRDRTLVFRNRRHAGEVLARILAGKLAEGSRILAVPAGGTAVLVDDGLESGITMETAVEALRDWTDLGDAAVLEILERSRSDGPRQA